MNKGSIVKYKFLHITFKKNTHKAFTSLSRKLPKQLSHFNKNEKFILATTIVAVLLVSAFGFLIEANKNMPTVEAVSNTPTASPSTAQTATPTSTQNPTPTTTREPPKIPGPIIPVIPPATEKQPGIIESSQAINEDVWKAVATKAWNYYQVGRGVDSTTGLLAGSYRWNYFTDWDLGVYIQAIIDAQKIGLIGKDGEWGASARLEKIVRFLETRELENLTKTPFWFYGSDGEPYMAQSGVNLVDTGALFVALSNLKTYEPSLASRIDSFVYNNNNSRTDYASVVSSLWSENGSRNIYHYYYVNGFASFFPEVAAIPNNILNNILKSANVTSYNITLPTADISCEPLLYSFFNLNSSSNIAKLMNTIYLVHEAKYNATGEYVAFSEGNTHYEFVWEWVVTSSGETWKITNGQTSCDIKPMIFTKVSLSFLAIYNTTFARQMSIYLERILPVPDNGYYDGADYNIDNTQACVPDSLTSNTNALILSAARYALHA